ncbi:MAG: hypothetical protein LBE56_14035 [Tannerella sp.]|nr:hypothetical protein [Tannerella sp.]
MKQIVLVIGLCFAMTVAYAQKASVTGAERMAKNQSADLNEARNLIKGALGNPETMNDPKTWFVAGDIEDAQYNRENTKMILGQKPDENVMYSALYNALPFYLKAYDLDQLPDAKGKIKPKYEKKIKGILSANHMGYFNAGAYYYDQNDYLKAYDFFNEYIKIANLPFFTGDPIAKRDSNYYLIQFYACVAAMQLEKPELAIPALEKAKDAPFRQNDVYQSLFLEYNKQQDTVNMEKTLMEGMKIFPDSSWYVLNLINLYISADRNDQAVSMLNEAISKNPNNSQLYFAMGSVYESGYKDNAKAQEFYQKQLDMDKDNPVALSNLGRVFYNQGIVKLNDANQLTDAAKYNAEKEVAKGYFKQALPFFEKSHQLRPDETEYMIALRGIYYQLDMNAEYEQMDAKMQGK